jgi:hypothetical protein
LAAKTDGAPWDAIRPRARRVQLFNSGLEVWLFDEQHLRAIRESGAISGLIDGDESLLGAEMQAGRLVGYSLWQDDGLDIGVVVGEPLTPSELACTEWLEPQRALLRLPSGRLCIDSNDSSRIGPETPTETGATLDVPPGDYRVTLHRADREALERQERTWEGPQEIVVLTPGGSAEDAARRLLPFSRRRDLSWVGQYRIDGRTFHGLVSFDDPSSTYVANLDAAAAQVLRLDVGRLLRVTCPEVGLTITTVFASNWEEGRGLAVPDDVDEYAYACITRIRRCEGKDVLFGRRAKAKTTIEARHNGLWWPATIEVLEEQLAPRAPGALIVDTGRRAFVRARLEERGDYYRDNAGVLAYTVSEVIEGIDADAALTLREALDLLEGALSPTGLRQLCDFSVEVSRGLEHTTRIYIGLPDAFVAVRGQESGLNVVWMSQMQDGGWVLTGPTSPGAAKAASRRSGLSVRAASGSAATILAEHRRHLRERGGDVRVPPATPEETAARYDEYLGLAFDPPRAV